MKKLSIDECRDKLKEWFVGWNIDGFSNEQVLDIYLNESEKKNSTSLHSNKRSIL